MNIEDIKFEHICEVCDVKASLLPEEAFNAGWDYPPLMGAWGIVSPRTCGDCGVESTLWWALTVDGKSVESLSERQLDALKRIQREPEFVEKLLESEGK